MTARVRGDCCLHCISCPPKGGILPSPRLHTLHSKLHSAWVYHDCQPWFAGSDSVDCHSNAKAARLFRSSRRTTSVCNPVVMDDFLCSEEGSATEESVGHPPCSNATGRSKIARVTTDVAESRAVRVMSVCACLWSVPEAAKDAMQIRCFFIERIGAASLVPPSR